MNVVDIIIIVVIAALVILAVTVSRRSKEKNSCGGECGSCSCGCKR